jgi:periplasmic copper chaperone A
MPMKFSLGALGAALSLCLFTDFASAHATLEVKEAPLNSTYKGVMRVPHGCEGLPRCESASPTE